MATKVVVADSGPLIALGRLDRLGSLPRLFETVQVPRAVLIECTTKPELADAQRIQAAVADGTMHLCDATPVDAPGLQLGERAAIGRAVELGAILLADDKAARAYTVVIGLGVIGTLGVLVRAKRVGALPELRPIVESLRASGYWLSDAAIAEALAVAGE